MSTDQRTEHHKDGDLTTRRTARYLLRPLQAEGDAQAVNLYRELDRAIHEECEAVALRLGDASPLRDLVGRLVTGLAPADEARVHLSVQLVEPPVDIGEERNALLAELEERVPGVVGGRSLLHLAATPAAPEDRAAIRFKGGWSAEGGPRYFHRKGELIRLEAGEEATPYVQAPVLVWEIEVQGLGGERLGTAQLTVSPPERVAVEPGASPTDALYLATLTASPAALEAALSP